MDINRIWELTDRCVGTRFGDKAQPWALVDDTTVGRMIWAKEGVQGQEFTGEGFCHSRGHVSGAKRAIWRGATGVGDGAEVEGFKGSETVARLWVEAGLSY